MKATSTKKKPPAKATVKENSFPVVAIGASAGGLEAMMELLKYLPADTGMAFIYVQHLSPDHKSMLTEILSKKTSMIVQEIDDMDKIKPNNVFVIPYNKGIAVTDGHIKLIPRSETSAAISIDILFSSLAQAQKERVIGIILSGSASDGTAGMKAIKQEGGLTFVQDDTAKITSMPHSAIAAGVVDFILSPKEIALELARLSKHPLIKTIGVKNGEENLIDNRNPDLKAILNQLHKATGVDFSAYKMSTIKRRIIRRMLLYKIKTLKEYAKLLLQKKPTRTANDVQSARMNHPDGSGGEEIDILYQDLLINVTSFFRDTDTHKYLKENLFPKLLKRKKTGESLRIWIPACATGEEAYSIAMMLLEIQGSQTTNTPIQIFATDLSQQAIANARIGVYTKQELGTVSPKRIQRFFTKSNGGFRVNKAVRDMCVFAPHNILQDPPFSRLDFISCCNLFIYLDIAAQKKAVNTFHYALNDDGFLMLGKSENISQSANLFTGFNKKYKIFSRKINSGTRTLPALSPRYAQQTFPEKNIPATNKSQTKQTPIAIGANHNGLDNAIDAVLVSEFMPASVVINHQMEIVQFRGTTDLFLTHPKGKATFNILKMARPEIAFELRNAISKVIKTKHRIRKSGIELKIHSAVRIISLEIVPLKMEWNEPLLLILFTEQEQTEMYSRQASGGKTNSLAKDRRIKKLEQELAAAHADALAIAQEQEAFTEELQSANEEVVSSNEELQTVNEELETSKEEIESANEELTTTNQELQTRNDLLNESYDFSEAVIATMHNPMVVLDKSLRVKSASKVFYEKFKVNEEETEGVLLYDLGNRQWNIPRLRELLENILPKNSHFHDYEITHTFPLIGERIMLLNASRIIQKTNHEELILLAFADVTEVRRKALELLSKEKEILLIQINAEQKLRKTIEDSETLFRLALFLTAKTVFKQDAQLRYTWIYNTHPSFEMKDILGKTDSDLLSKDAAEILTSIKQTVLNTGNPFTGDIQIEIDSKLLDFAMSVEATKNSAGKIDGIIAVSDDITERIQADKKIRESEKQNQFLLKLSDALRPLSNSEEIERTATKTALDFMGADRCYYCTREEGNAIIQCDAFREGLTSLAAVYAVGDFTDLMAAIDSGHPFVVDDVNTSEIVEEGLKQMCTQVQVLSMINVPVIKNGKTMGVFVLAQSKPRKWTEDEVRLSVETTERIWAAVERAKAEEKIKESVLQTQKIKEQLELSIAAGKIGVWQWDVKKDILTWSKEQREIYGVSDSENIISAQFNALIFPEDLKRIQDEQSAGNILEHEYDFRIKRKNDSQIRWIKSRAKNSFDEKGNLEFISGVNIDVSEQMDALRKIEENEKLLEQKVIRRTEELEGKNIELQNMNKELEAFTYVSSHDLQEPLRKIQTFASRILEKENQNLSDNGKNYFRLMQREAQRMGTLIQDLLAFSKLSTADRRFENTDLGIIIEEVKTEFKDTIAEKHAVIDVKEICEVHIIPFQFRQLMHNLISNALKFSNPEVPPHIRIESRNIKYSKLNIAHLPLQKEYCHISITDNGIGFEKEFSEKIFEVFQRLHGKDDYAGTGIGLAIVKKIVDNHNGIITATGKLNVGATFNIYIPTSQKNKLG